MDGTWLLRVLLTRMGMAWSPDVLHIAFFLSFVFLL